MNNYTSGSLVRVICMPYSRTFNLCYISPLVALLITLFSAVVIEISASLLLLVLKVMFIAGGTAEGIKIWKKCYGDEG